MAKDEVDVEIELSPEEEAELIEKEEEQRKEILDGLAKKITDLFSDRVKQRGSKEVEWLKCERLYNAPLQGSVVYNPDRPFAADDTAPRRPEPNIVRSKCDTAISNCVSMQFAGGEKNWDLFPPPNNLDPTVTEACRNMEKEIEAQLASSKYGMNARKAITDRVIYGSGILKGPVNTGRRAVKYVMMGNDWIPQVTQDYAPKITHVIPWRFFPDMSVSNFSEIQDAIEFHSMSAIELSQYIDHRGFDGEAIKSILKGDDEGQAIKPKTYNSNWESIKDEVWQRNPYMYKDKYAVLEYHGPVTYDDIEKLGLCPTYESPTQEYFGEVWVCCGKVIRMELENIEGYYETPYSMACWKKDPQSVFGFGHPLLLADPQQVITQSYHMILDNAALTSGPQVAMFKKYVQPIDGDWNIQPNKIWYLTDPSQTIDSAIKFFTPTNVIGNIMPVLELARRFADEESATPSISGDHASPNNQESATGALYMLHNSTTLLDFLGEEWDDQVTEKLIRRMYAWNMQYNDNNDIKGDYVVDVKSSSEYKNKQMYIRDLERLSMEVAQNPALADVINVDELTRSRLSLMHLPGTKIVRSAEEVQQIQQQKQEQPDPNMIKLQLESARVQIDQAKLELQKAQLQFENTKAMQQAAWDHEEKMGSNQARLFEAQAQVLKARSETQVQMLQLAQKDKQFAAKLNSDNELRQLAIQSQAFLQSMAEARKNREVDLTAAEAAHAIETGKGW